MSSIIHNLFPILLAYIIYGILYLIVNIFYIKQFFLWERKIAFNYISAICYQQNYDVNMNSQKHAHTRAHILSLTPSCLAYMSCTSTWNLLNDLNKNLLLPVKDCKKNSSFVKKYASWIMQNKLFCLVPSPYATCKIKLKAPRTIKWKRRESIRQQLIVSNLLGHECLPSQNFILPTRWQRSRNTVKPP